MREKGLVMQYCDNCGDEIEFRYIDGRSTPIHLHGGWCSSSSDSSGPKSTVAFQSRESYTDPNAHCPVCGALVFFYQSPHGGRVFFDNLGWPWPKHPCTDNPKSQSTKVKTRIASLSKPFLNRRGDALKIYKTLKITEDFDNIFLYIKEIYYPYLSKNINLPKKYLNQSNIYIKDIKEAPSFVLADAGDSYIISFISERRKKIINIKLKQ
ncbi:hypothetical protein [Sphingopyxis indica]|nr:hypothetical protein [Sphingopyxis indica]